MCVIRVNFFRCNLSTYEWKKLNFNFSLLTSSSSWSRRHKQQRTCDVNFRRQTWYLFKCEIRYGISVKCAKNNSEFSHLNAAILLIDYSQCRTHKYYLNDELHLQALLDYSEADFIYKICRHFWCFIMHIWLLRCLPVHSRQEGIAWKSALFKFQFHCRRIWSLVTQNLLAVGTPSISEHNCWWLIWRY